MAEKIVSPGVFSKEIDASFLPAAVGDIGAVVVGPTVKGPAMIPTVVESYSEFQAKFGDVFKSGSNYYQYLTSHTAKNYLENAGRLTVLRIMGSGYSYASTNVSSSTDPNVLGGGSFATGSFTMAHVDDDGLGTSMSLGGVKFIITGSDYTSSAVYPGNSATEIYIDSGSTETLTSLAINVKDAINNNKSTHKLRVSASNIAGVVHLTSSLKGPVFGTDGAGNLVGGSQISGTLDISDYGGAFTSVKQIQGGSETQTAQTPFKLHTLSHGTALNNSTGTGSNGVLTAGSNNNYRWEIGGVNFKKGTFSVLVRRGSDTEKQKQILETWNNCSLDPNQPNYISKVIGDQYVTISGTESDPFLTYTGDYPNKSKYIRVEVLKQTFDYLDENGNVRVGNASASLPSFHSGSNSGSAWGSFSGGADGTTTHPINFNENIAQQTQGFNLVAGGAQASQYLTALNLLANADEYDFNLLLLPGIIRNQTGHTAIVTKAIDVCEKRGDSFVIVDTVPYGTDAFGTVKTQAKAMNSNYAATYWPWCQVNDPQTGQNVWVPPSVVVAGMYSFNDKVGAPWFAPAGLNRGTLDKVVQAKRRLTHANRDDLYENNVNPIATFPGQGVVVWGQKTLQKKASALDRVNVRRLLIKVKKFISASSRFLVFEQNNAQTRERFMNIANPYLEQVQAQSGLNAFKVIMDETNNTPDVVDRNILYGQIFLQPTKTAEFIVLDFTIQPTGATFPE